jgi:hypothetical protein
MKAHPDKGGDPALFVAVTLAYEVLGNPAKVRIKECMCTQAACWVVSGAACGLFIALASPAGGSDPKCLSLDDH